jgi:peroxiredoxin
VLIFGVAWNGSEQSMQEFVDKHQLTFPNIKDNDGLVFAQFDVESFKAKDLQMKFVAFNIIGIIIGIWATVLVCMWGDK